MTNAQLEQLAKDKAAEILEALLAAEPPTEAPTAAEEATEAPKPKPKRTRANAKRKATVEAKSAGYVDTQPVEAKPKPNPAAGPDPEAELRGGLATLCYHIADNGLWERAGKSKAKRDRFETGLIDLGDGTQALVKMYGPKPR